MHGMDLVEEVNGSGEVRSSSQEDGPQELDVAISALVAEGRWMFKVELVCGMPVIE